MFLLSDSSIDKSKIKNQALFFTFANFKYYFRKPKKLCEKQIFAKNKFIFEKQNFNRNSTKTGSDFLR